MKKKRPKTMKIVERIDTALNGKSMTYADLASKVFPSSLFPGAWRNSSNGGPPGCFMPLSAALRRYDFEVVVLGPGPGARMSYRLPKEANAVMSESKDFNELHPDLIPRKIRDVPSKEEIARALVMGFRYTAQRKRALIGSLQEGTRTDVPCSVCNFHVTLSPASLKIVAQGAKVLCEVCADAGARSGRKFESIQSVEHVARLAAHRIKLSEERGKN